MLGTSLTTLINTFGAATQGGCDPNKTFFGIPVWYKYINVTKNADGSCNFSSFSLFKGGQFAPDSLFLVLLAILDAMLVIAGIVAVAFVIYGAIRLITSQGQAEGVKAARSTIINALIGLVIAISASALVNFLGNTLGN